MSLDIARWPRSSRIILVENHWHKCLTYGSVMQAHYIAGWFASLRSQLQCQLLERPCSGLGFPGASVQEMQEAWVQSLGQEDPLKEEMATHSSILDWKIPWMVEPGGLQSLGLQRVKHDWAHGMHTLPSHGSLNSVPLCFFHGTCHGAMFLSFLLLIFYHWIVCMTRLENVSWSWVSGHETCAVIRGPTLRRAPCLA